MKKLIFIQLLLFMVSSGIAQNNNLIKDFDDFVNSQVEDLDHLITVHGEEFGEMTEEFREYMKAEIKAFNEFRKEITQWWGADNFVESTNKDWVEYSDDKKSRSVVDFEEGTATIQILVEDEPADKVVEKIQKNLTELIQNKGTTKDYDTEYEKRQPLSTQPILLNQLVTSDNIKIEEVPMNKAVDDLTKNGEIEVVPVVGEDGKKRNMVNFKIDLAPDNIRTRAQEFLPHIRKYAEKYNIEPALICAIIHTESFFNPKAKSWANAHGLMQIVPTSAGRDTYRYVYKKEWTPTAQYLYDPDKNIELGTVYLHMLMNVNGYFCKVTDKNSRTLCSIAAYNTGAGNVSRTFIGTTKLGQAIPVINTHTYNSLYNHMYNNLPYEETRNYIKKVTEHLESYRSWSN